MKIHIIKNRENSENCYIITNGCRAIAVDPGSDAEQIAKETEDMGVQIEGILLTHCHYDHISGLAELREITGAPVYATGECGGNLLDIRVNVSALFGDPIIAENPEYVLDDGEECDIAGMRVKCIKTPGHTSCGACYLIENVLFSGDTLFLRSIGRYDLPTGDFDELAKSIREKLYKLADEVEVYPGHGGKTSIGYEKKFNLEVRQGDTGAM